MNFSLAGHIVIGLEIIVALWLAKRFFRSELKKITIEFNGNGKKGELNGKQSDDKPVGH